jgi:histidine triad (HIT) family protein
MRMPARCHRHVAHSRRVGDAVDVRFSRRPGTSGGYRRRMSESTSECVFCWIVAGDIPASVIAETDHSVAFHDTDPKAPTHVLVIPRRHVENLGALADHPDELTDAVVLARTVAAELGLEDGYRLVANTGARAHQTVFHAHLHVLGGREFSWPPG